LLQLSLLLLAVLQLLLGVLLLTARALCLGKSAVLTSLVEGIA
jgi:hypothetical protein